MKEESELKNELNLLEIILVGIGNILGAGIYVLMGKAAGLAGNMVWFSFLFAGATAALCPELYGTCFHVSKGRRRVEFVKELLENVLAICGLLVIYFVVITSSAVALGFGRYFSTLFGSGYLTGTIGLFIF